ncbi:MAG: type II toxin-antitoxin system HicB family antitoxin [Oscillospiraceae bacterium]|jgi:predicted HicB family RNase H-like nuclease|nr:type II toxin-antitoxin system HicB family antitoxin [Oscillospiraceae bacterium]
MEHEKTAPPADALTACGDADTGEWRKCNGKISLRVPKELHHSLLASAKENGVSLNQYIVYKLAR